MKELQRKVFSDREICRLAHAVNENKVKRVIQNNEKEFVKYEFPITLDHFSLF